MGYFDTIKDISALTPNGTEYFAAVGNGKRPPKEEVANKAKEEAIKLLGLPRYADMKENDVRWALLIRERNAILKDMYGWIMR